MTKKDEKYLERYLLQYSGEKKEKSFSIFNFHKLMPFANKWKNRVFYKDGKGKLLLLFFSRLLDGSIKFLVYFCDLKGKWRWWFPLLMRTVERNLNLFLVDLLFGGILRKHFAISAENLWQSFSWVGGNLNAEGCANRFPENFLNKDSSNLGPKKINLRAKKNERKAIPRIRLHNSSVLSHYKRFIISFSTYGSHKYFLINI